MSHDPDFETLRAALQKHAPSPTPAAQQAALTLALSNFDHLPRKRAASGGWRFPMWMASAMAVGLAVAVVLPRSPAPSTVSISPTSGAAPMPQMRRADPMPQGLQAPVWQQIGSQLERGERPNPIDPIAMLEAFGIPDPDAVLRHVIATRPAPDNLATQIASLAQLLKGDPNFTGLTAPSLPEAPQIADWIAKARALPPR